MYLQQIPCGIVFELLCLFFVGGGSGGGFDTKRGTHLPIKVHWIRLFTINILLIISIPKKML